MEWDIVSGAAAYGQFAGLMAGVAFIGLTLILTRQIPTETDRQRRLAQAIISDFLLAFVTLGLSAMEWTVLGGNPEQSTFLLTTRITAFSATVLLTVGTLQMVCGLCHLVMDFEARTDAGSLRWTCRATFCLVAAVSSFFVVGDLTRLLLLGFLGYDSVMPLAAVLPTLAAAGVTFAASRPEGARIPLGRRRRRQVTPESDGRSQRLLTIALAVVSGALRCLVRGHD